MDKPKPSFEELKHMTREQQLAIFKTYSKVELLELLNTGLKDLLKQVEQIPELIYEGLEKKLATDEASKREADALLARLRAPK